MTDRERLLVDLRQYAVREKTVAAEQVMTPGQSEAWREFWRGRHGAYVDLLVWIEERPAPDGRTVR